MCKKILHIGVTISMLWTQLGLAQQDEVKAQEEVQTTVHGMIGKLTARSFEGEKWEDDKKVLSKYSQDQLARALITELYVERGIPVRNRMRDDVVRDYFGALKLPPTLLCQELDKANTTERKVALMRILRDKADPAVTQALLRQLKDRRPAEEPPKVELAGQVHALRICDVACNVLLTNLRPNSETPRVEVWYSDVHRNEIIIETLKKLDLTVP